MAAAGARAPHPGGIGGGPGGASSKAARDRLRAEAGLGLVRGRHEGRGVCPQGPADYPTSSGHGGRAEEAEDPGAGRSEVAAPSRSTARSTVEGDVEDDLASSGGGIGWRLPAVVEPRREVGASKRPRTARSSGCRGPGGPRGRPPLWRLGERTRPLEAYRCLPQVSSGGPRKWGRECGWRRTGPGSPDTRGENWAPFVPAARGGLGGPPSEDDLGATAAGRRR